MAGSLGLYQILHVNVGWAQDEAAICFSDQVITALISCFSYWELARVPGALGLRPLDMFEALCLGDFVGDGGALPLLFPGLQQPVPGDHPHHRQASGLADVGLVEE